MALDQSILMFVKNPEEGMVKSRLASSIGDTAALDLYRCFVKDMMEMLTGTGYPYIIYFHPPYARSTIVQWLGDTHLLLPQTGDNLGERMKNAFFEVFSKGYQNAILIGSDSPDLPGWLISEAFASLHNHDAIIGPSLDGGYYLIGFRADTFLPEVFDRMPWSTQEVFTRTIDILQKEDFLIHILPQWRDIDTFDDLKALYVISRGSSFAGSATMRYIEKNRYRLIMTDDMEGVGYE
jgi:hypothetical protein